MRRQGILCLALLLMLTGCGKRDAGYAEDGYASGGVGDTMHTCFFDYTVQNAFLTEKFGNTEASQKGYELLVAEVTVSNPTEERITMYDTDFQMTWAGDPGVDAPITFYDAKPERDQFPAQYVLAPEGERRGYLIYEVPEGAKELAITHQELLEQEDGTQEKGSRFEVKLTLEKAEK